MASIYDYQATEASSSTTGGWNTAENQDPSTVNDGMRAHKQNVAKFLKDLGGTVTTTGSANAHAATLNQPIATTVPTGFMFRVKWGFTNTSTTVNLNLNTIGNARVKVNYDGLLLDPIPGDIRGGAYGDLIFDGTYHVLLNAQQQGRYPRGTLYGLTLTNAAGDATNDIATAVGASRDRADTANIDQTSTLVKRYDAAWTVGTGNGGNFASSTTDGLKYVWEIKRPDTGVVDQGFSTSSTDPSSDPNYPSAYTARTLIGSFVRTGGVNGVPVSYSNSAITPFARTFMDDATGAAVYGTLGATESLGSSGYTKLPNGLIIQWGTNGTASSDYSISFPSTFGTLYSVVASLVLTTGGEAAGALHTVSVQSKSASAFSVAKRSQVSGTTAQDSSAAWQVNWIATGI